MAISWFFFWFFCYKSILWIIRSHSGTPCAQVLSWSISPFKTYRRKMDPREAETDSSQRVANIYRPPPPVDCTISSSLPWHRCPKGIWLGLKTSPNQILVRTNKLQIHLQMRHIFCPEAHGRTIWIADNMERWPATQWSELLVGHVPFVGKSSRNA